MKKQGFTLVELSIVLVIIGLLTGGILSANAMIKAARVQKTASVFEQVYVAMQQFKHTYGTVAGDLSNGYDLFGSACGTNYYVGEIHWYSGGCNGNGNGYINHNDPIEKRISWVHLTHAEMWGDRKFSSLNFTSGSVDPQNTVNNAIATPYDGAYLITETPSWWHTVPASAAVAPSPNAAYSLVMLDSNVTSNAVKVSDAIAIDKKLDDGVGNTGLVRGSYVCLTNGNQSWNRSASNKCDVYIYPPPTFTD